jgi:hypothetical protein
MRKMKKVIYFCDKCGEQIKGNEPNLVELSICLEKYKAELCDKCTNNIITNFNKKG